MYLEYDWTYAVYRLRLGNDVWVDIDGCRSFDSRADAEHALATHGLGVGRKTDSRTWKVYTMKKGIEHDAR